MRPETADGTEDGAEERDARGGHPDLQRRDGGPQRSAVRREWIAAVGHRVHRLRVRAGLTPEDAAKRSRAAMERAGTARAAATAATEAAEPAPAPAPVAWEPVAGRLDAGRWRAIESGAVGALEATTLDEVFAMASVLGVTAQELMDTEFPLPAVDALRRPG